MNEAVDRSQPTVVTTSFIRQQINIGINDLMYQMSKQLAEIVKAMVQNEIHNMCEQEKKQHQIGGHSASLFMAYQ